jgi:hypothetical protein
MVVYSAVIVRIDSAVEVHVAAVRILYEYVGGADGFAVEESAWRSGCHHSDARFSTGKILQECGALYNLGC